MLFVALLADVSINKCGQTAAKHDHVISGCAPSMFRQSTTPWISRWVACLSLFYASACPQLGLDLRWEGAKKKSRTTERRREPQKKGLLVLSRCFEVCLFEKPERTAHGGWCKNLATSLALLIDSPGKYYEQSVTTAVSIRRDQCSWTNGNKKHQNKSNVHWGLSLSVLLFSGAPAVTMTHLFIWRICRRADTGELNTFQFGPLRNPKRPAAI